MRMRVLVIAVSVLLMGAAPPAPASAPQARGSQDPARAVQRAIAALSGKVPAARVKKRPGHGPPRVPEGMKTCSSVIRPTNDLPRRAGEVVRYFVDIDGLSVGTIDFKIERRGTFEGNQVTEYRSHFKLDPLVAAFVPTKGRAASLVPENSFWPTRAMNRYNLRSNEYEESVDYGEDGRSLASKRTKNGRLRERRRRFTAPVIDFVSGFYLLRSLPVDMSGCTVIYANQRAYTVWVEPDGQEKVKTPVGLRVADRYRVRFASERSKKSYEGVVWLGEAPMRVPYRAEIKGKHRFEVQIHMFDKGSLDVRR